MSLRADGKPARAGVLERATLIMDVFASGRRFVLLEQVADQTGLPRSTAFRMLRQLVNLGWLQHDARGYQLGARAQFLQARVVDHSDLRDAACAVLNELNLRTGAVCHLGVLEGASVHYLDKVGGAAAMTVPSRVGARLGAAKTVTGRALLASLSPEDVDRIIGEGHDGDDVDGASLARLHHELSLIRRARGVAFSDGERCALGISSVAAPVWGPYGAVAAISIVARRILPLHQLAPAVVTAARRTSERLYPQWRGDDAAKVRRVAAAV
ncbi:IclR family transcriptional regulator [Mycobacterium sherrisii]|uniref:IclR family transcriptional regulator n=1 Tax=Mycobacterium sherrisii TaxID=243061 RepID=UPI00397603F6